MFPCQTWYFAPMRSTDLTLLHPMMRAACEELESDLAREKIPLRFFEGFRTPRDQADLYFSGRVPRVGVFGKFKTFSRPWESRHQYGLAADYVFYVHNMWTWIEPEKGMWDRFHVIAQALDLTPLKFEQPHVQISGLSTKALQAGQYPPLGNHSWETNLAAAIRTWGPETRLEHGITLPGAPVTPESEDLERPDVEIPLSLVYDAEAGVCRPA